MKELLYTRVLVMTGKHLLMNVIIRYQNDFHRDMITAFLFFSGSCIDVFFLTRNEGDMLYASCVIRGSVIQSASFLDETPGFSKCHNKFIYHDVQR